MLFDFCVSEKIKEQWCRHR